MDSPSRYTAGSAAIFDARSRTPSWAASRSRVSKVSGTSSRRSRSRSKNSTTRSTSWPKELPVVDGNVERDEIEVAGEGLELRGGGEPGAVEAGDVQHERARAILAGGIRGEGEKNRGGPPDVAAREGIVQGDVLPRDGAVPRESEDVLAKGRRRGGRGRRGDQLVVDRLLVDRDRRERDAGASTERPRCRRHRRGTTRRARARRGIPARAPTAIAPARDAKDDISRGGGLEKQRATLSARPRALEGEMTCTRRWCRVTADQGCRAPTDRGRPSR